MNWGSWQEFFDMGGNGFFVWGSYGVSLLCMVFEPWRAAVRHRQARAEARRRLDEPSDDD
ncbi:MAG: heme exporter protein CcmD [Rubrivivax sp.]|jgi:heme exporter protein D